MLSSTFKRCAHGHSLSARPLNLPYRLQLSNRHARAFTVLALESSADDTCAAVVTSDRQILSNVVIKQHDIHEKFKGIEPLEALRGHKRNMPFAIQRALNEAQMTIAEIDGVAYTRGPGMPGCLAMCTMSAKAIAAVNNKPTVGVHHMQAHALTPFLTSSPETAPSFPFLTLLASGGHTLLLLVRSPTSFVQLATTVDLAVGTALDHIARLLDVPWSLSRSPGASLEEFAASIPLEELPLVPPDIFPHSMPKRLSWSFGGPESAVQRWYTKLDPAEKTVPARVAIARGFQNSVFDQLMDKLAMGLKKCLEEGEPIKHIVVSGGVASNSLLRYKLDVLLTRIDPTIKAVFPPPYLCTDNAAMIGWASMYRFVKGDYDDLANDTIPKWNLESLEISSKS